MKIFGGNKGDDSSKRQPRRNDEIASAREENYLRRLSKALEGGDPIYRIPEKQQTEPTAKAPEPPARPEAEPASPEPVIAPAPESTEDPFVSLRGGPDSELGEFSYGDIVLLQDETIGIYSRYIPEKEYDVVHMLQPDGTLDPRGLPLAAHGATTMGHLPAAAVRRCFSTNTWERDLIVFHLHEFGDAKRISQPSVVRNAQGKAVTKHLASETPVGEHRSPLVRGRRFSIKMGDRMWEAIHWGRDEQGALVAHRTSGEWALMHLDLGRFRDSLTYHEVLAPEIIQEIERSLVANSTNAEDS